MQSILMMFAVLLPVKLWYAPAHPINITVDPPAGTTVQLLLSDFAGKRIDQPDSLPVEAAARRTVDLHQSFPKLDQPGTYLLWAMPKGGKLSQFVGTPLVIEVRRDRRPQATPGPMVIRVEPLRFVVMHCNSAAVTMIFYYDVAPNTTACFQSLAETGFFDGLSFHRIVPGFVIQGGDPRGDGTGGPGYQLDAEFNDRPHEEGVLSMARSGDPMENPTTPPRPEFANSAGSQFFICLDYRMTQQLDRRYTAFGKVVQGMDVIRQIAQTPLADARTGRPVHPQVIDKMEVFPVTAEQNPYATLFHMDASSDAGPTE